MSVTMQEMINFHLTGKRGPDDITYGTDIEVCPALLVPYRQLSQLRYDFPLVLLDNQDSPAFADSLKGIMNRLMRDIAPEGNRGEQLRQHVLRLESRMRELVIGGAQLSLTQLWKRAEKSLLSESAGEEAETLLNNLATARFALKVEGQVVNCDDRLASRVLQHAFAAIEASRTKHSSEKIELLIIQLRNILKVDDLKNSSSFAPQKLKNNLGKRYKESFDFDLMSELLGDATPKNRLPAERRKRIKAALSELESQRFFVPLAAGRNRRGRDQYQFVVDSLAAALKAYNERLGRMAAVMKAIAIAELEIENAYREDKHAAFFDRFSPQALTPEDMALFPSYLICLKESECNVRDRARLAEIVTGDLPMKVLLEVDDALANQLGQTLTAPGSAFVLQCVSSNLFRQCRAIRRGLEFVGPAVFSLFTPRNDEGSDLPAYLIAAAAMESRVFPAFSYDPEAGNGLADRFVIDSNPKVSFDWPQREFSYEDEELQTVIEDYAFTAADFAVMMRRYGEHFVLAPRETWGEHMLPVADYLQLCDSDTFEKVPYVAVVDSENVLRRFVVDDQLIRMVRRCRERWHALQELGGVNNSYASAALENVAVQAPEAGEPLPVAEETQSEPVAEAAQAALDVEDNVEDDIEDMQAVETDEAYIETPLCTTCDECTNRNDRMFAYDENKQAYIKDIGAGTYRDLVEAAEACQVSIIHPGKPVNLDEPGLQELVARAEPFMV